MLIYSNSLNLLNICDYKVCLLHGTSRYRELVLYWVLIGVDRPAARRDGSIDATRPPRTERSEFQTGLVTGQGAFI